MLSTVITIERRIMAGEFGYHDPLPSEPDLAEWYGVSRTPNVRVLCTHDTANH
jgi:DNA-binding GntR family transcriptional regulator